MSNNKQEQKEDQPQPPAHPQQSLSTRQRPVTDISPEREYQQPDQLHVKQNRSNSKQQSRAVNSSSARSLNTPPHQKGAQIQQHQQAARNGQQTQAAPYNLRVQGHGVTRQQNAAGFSTAQSRPELGMAAGVSGGIFEQAILDEIAGAGDNIMLGEGGDTHKHDEEDDIDHAMLRLAAPAISMDTGGAHMSANNDGNQFQINSGFQTVNSGIGQLEIGNNQSTNLAGGHTANQSHQRMDSVPSKTNMSPTILNIKVRSQPAGGKKARTIHLGENVDMSSQINEFKNRKRVAVGVETLGNAIIRRYQIQKKLPNLFDPTGYALKKETGKNLKNNKPIPFLKQKVGRLDHYNAQQIQDHSNKIAKQLDSFHMFTGVKTLPASLISKHQNQVASFKRNFLSGRRVSDSSKQTISQSVDYNDQSNAAFQNGYLTADDSRAFQGGVNKHNLNTTSPGSGYTATATADKRGTGYLTDDNHNLRTASYIVQPVMDLRTVIENHWTAIQTLKWKQQLLEQAQTVFQDPSLSQHAKNRQFSEICSQRYAKTDSKKKAKGDGKARSETNPDLLQRKNQALSRQMRPIEKQMQEKKAKRFATDQDQWQELEDKKEFRKLTAQGLFEQFERQFTVPPMTSEDEIIRVKNLMHEESDKFNCKMMTPLTWQLARRPSKVRTVKGKEIISPYSWRLKREPRQIPETIPESIKRIKAFYPDIFKNEKKSARGGKNSDHARQEKKEIQTKNMCKDYLEKKIQMPKDLGTTTDVEESGGGYTKLIFGSNQIFDQQRKGWEAEIDEGTSFQYLRKEYPMKKIYHKYMSASREKEADIRKTAKERLDFMRHLKQQGIDDEETIYKQLLLYQWEAKKTRIRRERGRKDISDPKAHSIHISQMTPMSVVSGMTVLPEDATNNQLNLSDLNGVETNLSFSVPQATQARPRLPVKDFREKERKLPLEDRQVRIAKGRTRLKKKAQYAEDQLNQENQEELLQVGKNSSVRVTIMDADERCSTLPDQKRRDSYLKSTESRQPSKQKQSKKGSLSPEKKKSMVVNSGHSPLRNKEESINSQPQMASQKRSHTSNRKKERLSSQGSRAVSPDMRTIGVNSATLNSEEHQTTLVHKRKNTKDEKAAAAQKALLPVAPPKPILSQTQIAINKLDKEARVIGQGTLSQQNMWQDQVQIRESVGVERYEKVKNSDAWLKSNFERLRAKVQGQRDYVKHMEDTSASMTAIDKVQKRQQQLLLPRAMSYMGGNLPQQQSGVLQMIRSSDGGVPITGDNSTKQTRPQTSTAYNHNYVGAVQTDPDYEYPQIVSGNHQFQGGPQRATTAGVRRSENIQANLVRNKSNMLQQNTLLGNMKRSGSQNLARGPNVHTNTMLQAQQVYLHRNATPAHLANRTQRGGYAQQLPGQGMRKSVVNPTSNSRSSFPQTTVNQNLARIPTHQGQNPKILAAQNNTNSFDQSSSQVIQNQKLKKKQPFINQTSQNASPEQNEQQQMAMQNEMVMMQSGRTSLDYQQQHQQINGQMYPLSEQNVNGGILFGQTVNMGEQENPLMPYLPRVQSNQDYLNVNTHGGQYKQTLMQTWFKEQPLLSKEDLMKADPKLSFVDHNVEIAGLINDRKKRFGSHLARSRLLKMNREPETYEQCALLNNLDVYEQGQKIKSDAPTYNENLQQNAAQYDLLLKQEIQPTENDKSNPITRKMARNPKWDNTYNCGYYGLVKLREHHERQINNPVRDENIMKARMTAGSSQNFFKADRTGRALDSCARMADAKNFKTEIDMKVQQVIQECADTIQIPWKHVYQEYETYSAEQVLEKKKNR